MFLEFNERRQMVELDGMLKVGLVSHLYYITSDIIPVGSLQKGHVEVPRRSSFTDWNYHAEVKALQVRLGETFDGEVLGRALVMESHVEQERLKQEELGVEVSTQLRDNSELAVKGEKIIKTVLTRWLRTAYPLLPEEMITEVRQFLTTEQMLAEVGFHIGLREIVLSEEYPPSAATLKQSLTAVIAALAETDRGRAEQLVIDLVASQLQGEEIQEICSESLVNPLRILNTILSNSGLPPPESRLLFQTGQSVAATWSHFLLIKYPHIRSGYHSGQSQRGNILQQTNNRPELRGDSGDR